MAYIGSERSLKSERSWGRTGRSALGIVGCAYAAHRLLYADILVVRAPSVVNARCYPEWLRRAKADACPFPDEFGGGLESSSMSWSPGYVTDS